ncbi:MAG TPA: regulatory protein RecX [Patescibacteria group bacterium]|nr:regulatory protein RecX [Patescibacteria group bacterium]
MEDFDKFYIKAIHFLKYRPRSEKEIRDKLQSKKAPLEIIEQVIGKLTEQKFLNDEAFARWWIEQRMQFKPRSKRFITFELKQKGIDQEIIEQAFGNLENPISNSKLAKKIVEKKLPRFKHLPKIEIYQKLGRVLSAKGFDWDTIKRSIDEELK